MDVRESVPGERLNWRPVEPPDRSALGGETVELVPVDPLGHAAGLFAASHGPENEHIWDYLFVGPFPDLDAFRAYLERVAAAPDPHFYTVIDRSNNRPVGMLSYMRIEPRHGVIEIGGIWFSPAVQRSRLTTEAIFLVARHAFDDLGYRRLEWKCNARNTASRSAAVRFGFVPEGIFRQHMVVKDRNRDTAWYSITDRDWPLCRAAFEAWLAPENFDSEGRQRRSLSAIRQSLQKGEDA